jgi:hypothetical protein
MVTAVGGFEVCLVCHVSCPAASAVGYVPRCYRCNGRGAESAHRTIGRRVLRLGLFASDVVTLLMQVCCAQDAPAWQCQALDMTVMPTTCYQGRAVANFT